MMRILELLKVKRETGEWLCHTCAHAHIQKGYAENEQLIRCGYFSVQTSEPLPFRVRECSSYCDLRRFDFRGRTGRTAGFVEGKDSEEQKDQNAEALP